MKYSYDYAELIEELKEELLDDALQLTDTIQVLRAEAPVYENYRPIIDWYYDDESMQALLEPDPEDSEEELNELNDIQKHYLEDKPHLEEMLVSSCMNEIEQHTSAGK